MQDLGAVFLQNTLITDTAVAALKDAIPKCEVFR